MLVSNCKLSVHFEAAEDDDHGNMKEVAFAAMGNAINGCKDCGAKNNHKATRGFLGKRGQKYP
ncbi:unnamed protein product [Malus baccata var. baccata]